MKTEKFSGTVESAYGKTLPTPVKFSGEFEAFETYAEIVAANEVPSNDDIVTIVNAKRKAAKRAEATTEALTAAGISKPDPNSPDVVRANMIKATMKLYGVDEATATKIQDAAAAAAKAAVA